MEFNGQYLSFDEYKELGGTISKDMPFNLSEYQARKIIDKYTFGRLIDLGEQNENVKLCVFELIENLQKYSNQSNASRTDTSIKSESIDGYSVTYSNDFTDSIESKDKECLDIVTRNLSNCELEDGTPYLYRGTR